MNKNTNVSHLLSSNGNIYCIPVMIIAMNYPIEIGWDKYKKVFGGGFTN